MDLDTLFSGIDLQVFFQNFWEKAPYLLNTNEADRFKVLLTLDKLNQLLSEHYFRSDECKVAAAGKIIPDSAYLTKPSMKVMEKQVDDLIDSTELLKLFSQGATLVFNQFSRTQKSIRELKQNIENQLKATVLTNLFLSPPHSQGFSAHYDSHDVILLQLHGKKHWKVYESPIELPLKTQAFGKYTNPSTEGMKLTIDQEIKRGDILYIPRGFMHEALTSDETSLHLTLGIHRINKVDFIKDLLDRYALSDPQLRHALPFDFETCTHQKQISEIKNWLQLWSQSLSPDHLSMTQQSEQRRINSDTPQCTPNHLNHICDSFNLTDDFTVQILNQDSLGIAQNEYQSILFQENRKVISMPTDTVQGFSFLTGGSVISSDEFPESLSLQNKKQLARTLIAAGVAKPTANDSN